ncbi:hypothetical protein AVEN_31734-1 [Araneus ventricosus]|uniref:Uncharacterized protein n=1 Tax=Araneus ventricosus TaxID=182803 RepID=A0A4Y2K120_ARAVE|nr:hypothetical protein AVEN_31734-1 [Araneus ventricosus]
MTKTTLELSSAFQTSATQKRENASLRASDLKCNWPICMADFQWNRVSNLEPSRPKLTGTTACKLGEEVENPLSPYHTLLSAIRFWHEMNIPFSKVCSDVTGQTRFRLSWTVFNR